jgi:hypothetical protein
MHFCLADIKILRTQGSFPQYPACLPALRKTQLSLVLQNPLPLIFFFNPPFVLKKKNL